MKLGFGKDVRFLEFVSRMQSADDVASATEALARIGETLAAVVASFSASRDWTETELIMSRNENPIQNLGRQLTADCPDAAVTVDKPKKASGVWFLDIVHDGHSVNVQWQTKRGFGVSSSSDAQYGEGADEIYDNSEAVRHRVLSLLLSQGETSPPAAVRLAELRRELGLSQIELAQRLCIQQGAVSRMERRGDIKVSSLREYCQSLGGNLMLMARFPNGSAKVIHLDDEQKKA